MNIAIIGAGLIGTRRALIAQRHPETNVVIVADTDGERARACASRVGAGSTTAWNEAIRRDDIHAVVVATTHDMLADISLAAMRAGKHLLVEKPMAVTLDKAEEMVATAARMKVTGRVGYNLRFHPSLIMAREKVAEGIIGEVCYLRAAYGHGGRPGYENEWRCDRARSGGGELMDQGVHLLDLSCLFLGDFSSVTGIAPTTSWPIAPLEDNVFALLGTDAGKTASLHASWTQWKNLFRFEIFGEKGYLLCSGLGGSYGPEQLTIGIRAKSGGRPAEEIISFEERDCSWEREWTDFVAATRGVRGLGADLRDGCEVLKLVEKLYRASSRGRSNHLQNFAYPTHRMLGQANR